MYDCFDWLIKINLLAGAVGTFCLLNLQFHIFIHCCMLHYLRQ